MAEVAKFGRIMVDTEIARLSYRVVEARHGDDKKPVVIIEFELKRAISPDEAVDVAKLIRAFVAEFVRPNAPSDAQLYAVSGRGPIWLYALILHQLLHIVPAIGVFDPKIGAAGGVVVIAVHSYSAPYNEGQVVELEPRAAAQLTQ